jgi:nitrate/nitrite sensing protein/HAAS domain-containing protein
MSRTVLDHRLVRDYLCELDAAMRALPAAQASELREQIAAHLHDALGPDADDHEVAATLSRLGSPADLAAEAGAASGSSGPRFTPGRWRLAVVIAVIAVIAAVFGALQIRGDASNDVTSGRDQHLAQLDAAVVKLTQALEDERDLSAGYAADRAAGARLIDPVKQAQDATSAAARTVLAEAAAITPPGAGYQPATVSDLIALTDSLKDLRFIRQNVTSSLVPALQVIQLYSGNVLAAANTFSALVGTGANDAGLQGNLATLGALLRVENQMSVQRAVLYAALSAQPPALTPAGLTNLEQAAAQETADLTAFTAAADTAQQHLFATTVAGPAVNQAVAQETLAEADPSAPLTRNSGLDAATWYRDMSTIITDTRVVADQDAGQITIRANTLKANAAKSLLLTSIATLVLLVLLISTALARSNRRGDGKPRPVRM